MSEAIILALPSGINDSEMLIDGEVNGQPAILSTKVADRFNKQHKNLLRDIDQLQSILPASFVAANFGKTYYELQIGNGATRKSCAFLLTRDAFSLLVMGMTGKAAIIWKLRYIEAFNALERAALENQAELAREAGYLAGRQEALCLPVMEAERKQGYLEGLKEGKKLAEKNDRLKLLEKMAGYIQKGLNYTEIGKILGLSKDAVGKARGGGEKEGLLAAARKDLPDKSAGGDVMKEEKLDARDLLDVDRLPRIEAMVAFIAMASSALGVLDKRHWDGLLPSEPWKAWEGLAWITDEIRNDLHEWLERVK